MLGFPRWPTETQTLVKWLMCESPTDFSLDDDVEMGRGTPDRLCLEILRRGGESALWAAMRLALRSDCGERPMTGVVRVVADAVRAHVRQRGDESLGSGSATLSDSGAAHAMSDSASNPVLPDSRSATPEPVGAHHSSGTDLHRLHDEAVLAALVSGLSGADWQTCLEAAGYLDDAPHGRWTKAEASQAVAFLSHPHHPGPLREESLPNRLGARQAELLQHFAVPLEHVQEARFVRALAAGEWVTASRLGRALHRGRTNPETDTYALKWAVLFAELMANPGDGPDLDDVFGPHEESTDLGLVSLVYTMWRYLQGDDVSTVASKFFRADRVEGGGDLGLAWEALKRDHLDPSVDTLTQLGNAADRLVAGNAVSRALGLWLRCMQINIMVRRGKAEWAERVGRWIHRNLEPGGPLSRRLESDLMTIGVQFHNQESAQ